MNARMKTVAICAMLAAGTLGMSHVAHAAKWKVTDLGPVGLQSFLYVNNAGQVAGTYSPDPQGAPPFTAFVTGPNGTNRHNVYASTTLQSMSYGINDAGTVMTAIGSDNDWTLQTSNSNSAAPGFTSIARSYYNYGYGGINNAGKVAGSGSPMGNEPSYNGFMANQDGSGFTALGADLNPRAINASGQILLIDSNHGSQPSISGANGVGAKLIQKPSGVNFITAFNLNDSGQVVGEMRYSDNWPHAYVTGANGVGVKDLGTLGSKMSNALGINKAGQVVGDYGDNQILWHAFITDAGGKNPRDLSKEVTLPNGGYLTTAYSINDKGQVAASDYYNGRAYLLTPEADCTVTYKVTAGQSSSFDVAVTVANLSTTAVKGWQVNWTYTPATIPYSIKNAVISNQNYSNFTAKPTSANTTVAANGSTTFSFKGIKRSGVVSAVSNLTGTLGGQTCQVIQ